MEKITYILGAGFSAPLGLPVMSNFLVKSKDMFFENPEKHKHFEKVFKEIQNMSVTKNYFNTDLFNIEEILSIIEMSSFVQGKRLKSAFVNYICDVIEHHTPPFTIGAPNCANWYDFVLGNDALQSYYGYFISSLLNIYFQSSHKNNGRDRVIETKKNYNSDCRYSVISMNYDLVLEKIVNQINTTYSSNLTLEKEMYETSWESVHLSKLHGCIEMGNIIPPTWAKGVNRNISPFWKNAYHILMNSTQIRFIGYSLPTSDSYIKYLLKAAISFAPHLKNIDVISLDQDGSLEERFNEFIHFNYFKFKNGNVVDYLQNLSKHTKKQNDTNSRNGFYKLDGLEEVHRKFMSN